MTLGIPTSATRFADRQLTVEAAALGATYVGMLNEDGDPRPRGLSLLDRSTRVRYNRVLRPFAALPGPAEEIPRCDTLPDASSSRF